MSEEIHAGLANPTGQPASQPTPSPASTHETIEPVGGLPDSPMQLTADVASLQQAVATLQGQVAALQQQLASLSEQAETTASQTSALDSQTTALMTHTHTFGIAGRDTSGVITLDDVAQYVQGASGFGEYANWLVPVWDPVNGNPPGPGTTGTTSKPVMDG